MKLIPIIFLSIFLTNCAPSNPKQYLFSESKKDVVTAVNGVAREFKYNILAQNGDTIIVEGNKAKGTVVVTESNFGKTVFIPQIEYSGIRKQIFQDFIYGCLKQELENDHTKVYSHERKTFGKFLLRNTVSPIWGTKYIFENDPFDPPKAKQAIFFVNGSLDLISIGMMTYGAFWGHDYFLSNGGMLFAMVRALNGMNFNLTKVYNEHIYLKYDFDKIQVSF